MCPVDTIRCTGTKFNSVCKLDLGSLGTCPIPRPVYDIPWLYGGLYGLGLDYNVALFYLTLAKQYGWDYSGVEYDSRKEDMGCITIPRVNLVEGNPVLAPKGADFAHVREFNNGNKVMMLFDFVTDPTLEERNTDIIACESLRSEIEGWLGGKEEMSLEQLLRELNDYIYKNYNHAKATGMIALKVGDKISVAHWGDVGFCFYTETFLGMPTLYPVEPGLWGGKYFKLMDEFIAKLSNMMEGKIPDDLRTELEDLRRKWYVESFGVKYKEKLYPAIGNEDSNDFIKKVRFLEVDFPDCAIMGWSDGLELLARFYETQAINLALTIKRNLSQKQNLINWLVTSSAYFQERKLYSLNSEVRKKSDDMAFATIGTQNRLVGNAYERNECQIYDPIRILECYSVDEVLRFGTISELVGRFDNELTEILEKYVGQASIARIVEEGFLPPR